MCMEMRTGMWVWAKAGAGVFSALCPGAGPLLCWTGECDGAELASQQHVGSSTFILAPQLDPGQASTHMPSSCKQLIVDLLAS